MQVLLRLLTAAYWHNSDVPTMSPFTPLLGPKLTLSDRINQADHIHW